MKIMLKSLKIVLQSLKWIIITGIVLFSIATFMGKAYLQTLVILLIAVSMAYWPALFRSKWNKKVFSISRVLFILLLLIVNILFFRSRQKTSIYLSETHKKELLNIYNQKMADWPGNTEDIYIQTTYGTVHVLACGSKKNPPLMMIHAASMGAHSWVENLDPLLENYRIYSIDNIGEGNKSDLKNVLVFPENGKEIADLYAFIANSLDIKRSPVFGASNGGFIAMNYAFYYPEKVESLALFGPMGLTPLTGKSIFMLSVASMYPFKFIRNYVTKWAIGNDEYCNRKYGDWFNSMMKGTIPSVARPVPMTTAQKQKMDLPVLLFLGTKDAIVGDVTFAKQTAKEFPDIQIQVLESGHLIAVEKAAQVNKIIKKFLE